MSPYDVSRLFLSVFIPTPYCTNIPSISSPLPRDFALDVHPTNPIILLSSIFDCLFRSIPQWPNLVCHWSASSLISIFYRFYLSLEEVCQMMFSTRVQ